VRKLKFCLFGKKNRIIFVAQISINQLNSIHMYAIVDIGGKQFKVEKDRFIYTARIEGAEGSKVEFENVLLLADNNKYEVGAPSVKGAKVTGKILEHVKDDKVIAFKKKRRKGFVKTRGHRTALTKVLIENISK
jgi:large subunit ribosomal protein L21